MFKLNLKFDGVSLLFSLRHFECDGHTVQILTQRRLLTPLTSTVKLSLFTHAHSSPLSLAARLHQCCSNHSRYINNSWTFSRQTSLYIVCSYINILCTYALHIVCVYVFIYFVYIDRYCTCVYVCIYTLIYINIYT